MTFSEVQSSGEAFAIDTIEAVRQKIVLGITRSQLSPIGSAGFRREISDIVTQGLGSYRWQNLLTDSWHTGVERASEHMAERSASGVSAEIGAQSDELRGALGELRESMIRKLTNALNKAILTGQSKEELIDAIGNDTGEGMFKSFQNRAVGSVSHEMEMADANGYAKRLHEIGHVINTKRKATLGSVAANDKPQPVAIKIWYHSFGGNPPRAWHVAMHGKAVMYDQKFKLVNPKDGVHWAEHPHDVSLPAGETINCRCAAIPKIIYLTHDEEQKLRARMAATGGLADGEWAEQSAQDKKTLESKFDNFKKKG